MLFPRSLRQPSDVTCGEQEPLTSLVLPWGKALGGKRGRKKEKSISVYQACPVERTVLTPLALAPCRTPHSSIQPSCSQSLHHGTPSAGRGQSHKGFEPTRDTQEPALHVAVDRVVLPKPPCLWQGCRAQPATLGQHCPFALLCFRRTFSPAGKLCPTAHRGCGAATGTFTSLFLPAGQTASEQHPSAARVLFLLKPLPLVPAQGWAKVGLKYVSKGTQETSLSRAPLPGCCLWHKRVS